MAKLVLCKGVELEPNYEHTFDFPSATIQGEYFASKKFKEYNDFLPLKDRNASLFKGIIAKENYDYVKVPEYIDTVRECSYMYWQNEDDSKIYYAFITNSYYVNAQTSVVEYELDVIQTFLFDYKIEGAHIAREHQNRLVLDSGSKYNRIFNVQPENLNIGKDYMIAGNQKFCKKVTIDGVEYPLVWINIVATEPLFDSGSDSGPSFYMMNNNLYVYVIPYLIGKNYGSNYNISDIKFKRITDSSTYTLWSYQELMNLFLSQVDSEGKSIILPKIFQITMTSFIPRYDKLELSPTNVLIEDNSDGQGSLYKPVKYSYTVGGISYEYYVMKLHQDQNIKNVDDCKLGEIAKDLSITFSPTATLTPSKDYESKLFTDPYAFMQLIHNNQSVNLKYENVNDKDIMGKANIYGVYSFLIYNKDYAQYNDTSYDDDNLGYMYGVASKPVNDVPLTSDPYLNYMLTKSSQAITGMAVKTAGGSLATIGGLTMAGVGIATGNLPMAIGGAFAGLSGVTNIASAISEEMAKREDLQNTPDSLNNLSNDGTFSVTSKTIIPIIQYLEIRPDYKEIIYNYFRLYGYKSNRFAKPISASNDGMNLKSRYYFNYIKCTDINIEMTFNRDYHDKIISIFKNGITFWHFRSGMAYNTFKPFNYNYENIEVDLLL